MYTGTAKYEILQRRSNYDRGRYSGINGTPERDALHARDNSKIANNFNFEDNNASAYSDGSVEIEFQIVPSWPRRRFGEKLSATVTLVHLM